MLRPVDENDETKIIKSYKIQQKLQIQDVSKYSNCF